MCHVWLFDQSEGTTMNVFECMWTCKTFSLFMAWPVWAHMTDFGLATHYISLFFLFFLHWPKHIAIYWFSNTQHLFSPNLNKQLTWQTLWLNPHNKYLFHTGSQAKIHGLSTRHYGLLANNSIGTLIDRPNHIKPPTHSSSSIHVIILNFL